MSHNWEIYQAASTYKQGPHISYGTGVGQLDCSHFVAQVLTQATGTKFDYIQANSYEHSPHFSKIDIPDKGDLVMWHRTPHGHVGIVMDPTQHIFIGAQSHGVGTDHYNSTYWKAHGSGPMFFRYNG